MIKEVIFQDPDLDKQFKDQGFLKYGNISPEAVAELTQLYQELNIPDFYGCGYNCGMNSDRVDLRTQMQIRINEVIYPFTSRILNDFTHYSATFVNKLPVDDCFVTAHQDFSYTDEREFPSFMCFIPMQDVDINNAALGVIPESHKFFEYVRAFPFPFGQNPVSCNDVRLMNYLKVVPMKAGEMLFFYQNTIHGSFNNYSNKERLALSFSLVKNKRNPYAFIHNPKTNGKTILKYEVDHLFITKYNNPAIMDMFINGEINIPYPLLEEFENPPLDNSWESVNAKLAEYGTPVYPENGILIDKYLKKKRRIRLKNDLYNFAAKILKFSKKNA